MLQQAHVLPLLKSLGVHRLHLTAFVDALVHQARLFYFCFPPQQVCFELQASGFQMRNVAAMDCPRCLRATVSAGIGAEPLPPSLKKTGTAEGLIHACESEQ